MGDQRGSGERPLVLVHGFGGSRLDWDPVIARLPESLTPVRYDQRGFGESDLARAPYSHSEDLAAILAALDLQRVDLCGMSLGGATALSFALDHPERVDRLILISPLIAGWPWSEEWIALWKGMGRAARGGDIDTARALWLDHPLFAQVRGTSAEDELRQSIARFHGQQWVEDPAIAASSDVERLAELATPTLLLTGERDMPDFRLIADRIESTAPQVKRIDYAGAGHMLPIERPEPVARAIAEFVSGSVQPDA